eukprot:NODE_1431_length_1957_cov_53.432388_g1212_i0.p1 GENE.NODE_1431_length_1957_cov_53.432388_g1212_i0~~NODE_1431_length_1957_cov_53.432388_g1212_i0.p1  ORF type:complete len:580 (+),score=113.91 NODE_1431_length_1957_cov_53.432388_g1212_i0:57-1796(+)
MSKGLILLLAFCLPCFAIPYEAFRPTESDFHKWMNQGGASTFYSPDDSISDLSRKVLIRLNQFADQLAATSTPFKGQPGSKFARQVDASADYPYLGFLPRYIGTLKVNSKQPAGRSDCWGNATLEVVKGNDEYTLKVHVMEPREVICTDAYAFTTVAHIQIGVFPTPIPGTKSYSFKLTGLKPAEIWDIENKGIRVFHFRDGLVRFTEDLTATLSMFSPILEKTPSAAATKANLEFLLKYRNLNMAKRATPVVPLDESQIHSGDFIGVIRLDGLDPMLAYGMGSSTGHTAVALWENGQLYIAESTTNSTYWPTNGIQRTPYAQWIKQAIAAGYNLVHAPLSDQARAVFNEKAANDFFHSQENLQYGFGSILVGWIDTIANNYPCLPPFPVGPDSFCLTWELIETMFPILEKAVPVVGKIFVEAWNHRVNATGLTPAEVLQKAAQDGIPSNTLFSIPEQDKWLYKQQYNNGTYTTGKSMVCNVFVCNTWKHGGLFDSLPGGRDSVNCGETTNLDVYALNFLTKPATRPVQCQQADPDNFLCQLTGDYSLVLNDYASKSIYPQYAERCPGTPPDYVRPAKC